MAWTWRFEAPDGSERDGEAPVAQPAHTNRSDAESWLGENWRELADAGVASVSLYDDDTMVYGPMSLSEG